MGIISFILVGLVAGVLAKVISPGDENMGWVKTIILGLIGSVVGAFIGNLVAGWDVTGFNFGSILLSTGGAVVVLYVYKKFIAK